MNTMEEEKDFDDEQEQQALDFTITQMYERNHGGGGFASQLRCASEITMRGSRRSSLSRSPLLRWASERTALKSISVNEICEDPAFDTITKSVSETALKSIGVKELCEDPAFDTAPRSTDSVDETDSQIESEPYVCDPIFESRFAPEEMRCLALVAHNHMKPAMKDFVKQHLNLLKKFRLTGTGTTMMMLREVVGDEHMDKHSGPVCKSGPLGGDAELVAQMCSADMGAIFFFQDPMDSHPHSADIECLNRQTNVHNIMACTNPTSAHAATFALRQALMTGDTSIVPSFFTTCVSPSVKEYKKRQAAVLVQNRY
jgi:methylglyoxal synthase